MKQKLICPRESEDKRKRKEKGFEMSRHSRQGVGEIKRKEKEKREERREKLRRYKLTSDE